MELRNKKVLVTGADGFIGSHLVERLLEEGCNVRAFVYYNSAGSWGWLDTIPKCKLKDIEIFMGDIRDPNGVRTAVRDVQVVFHLAALIGIPFSYHSPDSYIDTNIKGTLNVLQAARDRGVEKVLVTSTSEVYGTARYVPIDEVHPRQGQSPYAASKIAADALAESFYRSFGLPVVTVRPFNTYGPRQSMRAVIPTIIMQLRACKQEISLGALHPTRDLVYVHDTVEGFVRISLADNNLGEEVNIATQQETSVGDAACFLINMINPQARIVTDQVRLRPEKSEVERLLGSNEKLMSMTGWKPACTLYEGLQKTVEWFNEEDPARFKPDLYSI